MSEFNMANYLKFWGGKVEEFFETYITCDDEHLKGLISAMRYSLFAGGKRLRPALVYSSYGIFEGYFDKVTPFASAVEMLHTYSLIHDDLPAMDDDDMRRGKPTNHKMYGEATAILAGDGLLTKSFEVMCNKDINPDVEASLMLEAAFKLAVATGENGMVGGQFADMESEDGVFNSSVVDFIHTNKTSKLIAYCCELGAILGYGSDEDKKRMREYGMRIGLAFQIVDDILDITSTTQELGKDVGSDEARGKATYPAIHGVEQSHAKAELLIEEALEIISVYGKTAEPCREIAKFIIERKN
ncbi:MAG: polyprenyl synthetase [Denitrovibrio sp.]|nr:MAG: polyprenyl synthetase [Denitrovibrio sp.]